MVTYGSLFPGWFVLQKNCEWWRSVFVGHKANFEPGVKQNEYTFAKWRPLAGRERIAVLMYKDQLVVVDFMQVTTIGIYFDCI